MKKFLFRGWAIGMLFLLIVGCSGATTQHRPPPPVDLEKSSQNQGWTGPYMGQRPPQQVATVFAPDIVSQTGRFEYALSFAPDGKALLFSTQLPDAGAQLYYSEWVGEQWRKPTPIQLTGGDKKEEMEAFFCPDGKTVFFAPYNEFMDVRIWRVTRGIDGFEQPTQLESPVNDGPAFYPTCTSDGTLYYTRILEKKIYRAKRTGDAYSHTAPIGIENTGHLYIAADEQTALIDSRREGGYGDSDIYFVRKTADGQWGEPQNLGEQVNTSHSETCPSFSHDGKYIFFSRYDEPGELSNIYWISSEILSGIVS